MARWRVLILTAVCLHHSINIGYCTKFLVTLPKQLHYDSEVLATVTAVNVPPQGDVVTLTYRGAKNHSRVLNKTELEFKKDGVQTWSVVFPWERIQNQEENGVNFEIGDVFTILVFAPDPGYIFIQTDKPIYTPRQTVRFRIIAVDFYQTLAKYQLKVDIKSPQNIIVDRMRYSAEEAFRSQTFELPREATVGIWSISANFEGLGKTYSSTKSVEFEVIEYALPRFSADLKINIDVIAPAKYRVSLFISGKYVYRRPLLGTVEMQLGVLDPDKGVQLFPDLYKEQLINGKAKLIFRIIKMSPKDKRLYVSLNVTEAGTGENDTIVDTSAFLGKAYYEIDFSAADQYFKPGFPYTLKASVRSKSGLSVSSVPLRVFISQKDYLGKNIKRSKINRKSDKEGKFAVKAFKLSKKTETVKIRVRVRPLNRLVFGAYKHYPTKYKTLTNQFIHVSMLKPIGNWEEGKVLLLYTTDVSSVIRSTMITLQVLSKGQVIHTKTIKKKSYGRSTVKLPCKLYALASPSMRVVAYYYATLGNQSEFVGHSLLVDTEDACVEEIFLDGHSLQMQKPKEKYTLFLDGKPNTTVGLAAIDEAVFLLNNKQTLTRESFFQEIEITDHADGTGDGENFKQTLANAGLQYLIFDTLKTSEAKAEIDYGKREMSRETTIYKRDVHPQQRNVKNFVRTQTTRTVLPQSWLFEEFKLDTTGFKKLVLTLPDAITTWNFMAVSLSPQRRVCVSEPFRVHVRKLLYADVKLPYKVTRFEEVKVKVVIYNYQLLSKKITGVVTGVDGICFPSNPMHSNYTFWRYVGAKGTFTEVVKIIPVKYGELTLRVAFGLQDATNKKDVLEKKIFVVAGGRRVHKSMTFLLDPEAGQMSQQEKIIVKGSPLVNNSVDIEKKDQSTVIDLALPEEVIMGTQFCRIKAFGDLMGDIITHAVVESKSLVDQPMADAEEVLGDLGPTVHALLYINESGLANEELAEKGRRFVRHSVVRLIKYRDGGFYKLTPKSKPATWLTAAVLKTLCYASKLTFLDKENLIDKSFSWLAEQVNYRKGTILELDWRVSQDSLEYKVMLSAEVLITLLECKGFVFEKHFFLMAYLVTYLEEHLHKIQQPVVLAKSVYALDLSDEKDKDEVRSKALKRLLLMKRTNKLGQYFWAEKDDDDDSGSVPFWYQLGAKASSIEATSYALLVFLQRRGQMEHIDSIADWLVGQRNKNGAFVGAMDSMAAIQALSRYSLAKRQGDLLETDLSCNVISEIFTGRQTHSFKFTQQDATSPKSVDNVPVGHKLKVSTKGKGLGQMQVNVEYNVPVDRNAICHFNLTVMVKSTEIRWTGDMLSNPICNTCGIGCHEKSPDKREETKMEVRPSPGRRRTNKRRVPQTSKYRPRTPTSANSHWNLVHSAPPVPNIRRISPPSRKLPSSTTSYRSTIDSTQAGQNQRHRSRRSYTTASKFSICIHVCLRHMQEGSSGYTFIEVEMLTGYLPVISDLDRIEKNSNIRKAQFLHDRDIVVVQFDRVPSDEQTCFTFRAVEEHEVEKRTPASVVLRQAGLSQPSCALEYNPVRRVEYPLQGYCTNTFNEQGECPCFSGRCSSCLPTPGHRAKMNLDTLMNMACEADVGYELKVTNVTNKNQWVEIDATVIQRNKTGSHAVQPNETITLMTPSVCNCPHFYFPPGGETEDMMYMLSTDAEIFLDRRGQRVYRYLLDERSKILRVSHSAKKTLQSSSPAASHYDLETAFLQLWKCE